MLLKAKVFAGSKHFSFLQKTKISFEVCVKEKAERGEANRAVICALADYFKILPSRIRMVKGGRRPNKIFKIDL